VTFGREGHSCILILGYLPEARISILSQLFVLRIVAAPPKGQIRRGCRGWGGVGNGPGGFSRPPLRWTSKGVSIGESDCVAPLHRRQDSHGIIFGPRKVTSYSDVTGPVSPPLSGDKVAIMLADPSNCRREDQGTLFLSWNLPRLQSGVSRAPASLMLIVLT